MDPKRSDWRPGPTVCRCCFAEGCYKDISTEYFWMGKREVYSEMLSETFDVTIGYMQTGGPNSNSRLICEPCISRLRDAADFKRQVQECERVFQNHLARPGTSLEFDIEKEEVKLERVKLETKIDDDDDDFDDLDHGVDQELDHAATADHAAPDDDDDDMDDQPLTALASKVPKQEADDLLKDFLKPDKKAEKRKSTTKVKASPVKKPKKKESPKPSVSKPAPKLVEKKKKECDSFVIARHNAKLVVQYTTAYPFRLPEEAMLCVYCGESYAEPSLYRLHMDTEHQGFTVLNGFVHQSIREGYVKADCTDLRCRLCITKLENLESAKRHLVKEHNKNLRLDVDVGLQPFVMPNNKFNCALCNHKAASIRSLSYHTQQHFLKFTCEVCGKRYVNMTSLKVHTKFSHRDTTIDGEIYVCRKCNKSFKSMEDRRTHVLENQRCWLYACNTCGERFLNHKVKQQHMVDSHGVEKKMFKCRECSAEFDDSKRYRSHFKLNHTDDHYQCSFCGLRFASTTKLEDHRVIHTKEKLFSCEVCEKAFSRKKGLIQHMWMHNELKRFKCTICDKLFNQKVSWKGHMRTHHPNVKVNFDENKLDRIKVFYSS